MTGHKVWLLPPRCSQWQLRLPRRCNLTLTGFDVGGVVGQWEDAGVLMFREILCKFYQKPACCTRQDEAKFDAPHGEND